MSMIHGPYPTDSNNQANHPAEFTPRPRLYQHSSWTQRDLNEARYVYLWADGIYSNVRQDGRL
ncbi:hypothetical protein EWM60_18175 [Candidatus Erwinia dacicola]|nr:hypothetical protein [Candidatus Erwinia dacicola]